MFDWQTEDDVNWDEPEEKPNVSEPKRRRRWPLALLGLAVLLGITAVIVWQQVQRRVAETTAQVEEDVLASVRVIEQAASAQDADLFVTFLSGRDGNWATDQEIAVRDNQYLNRSLFSLEAMEDAPSEPEVNLNLDLTSATVRTPRSYSLEIGNGIQETIVLSQTAVYRPGPNRWLLSPPDPEFWGEPSLYSGVLLNVEYPDGPYNAFELSRDLDQFVTQLCTEIATFRSCGGFIPFQVSMTHSTPTLSNLEVLRLPGIGDYRTLILGVPSPVVVGLPTNELSYRALYNGYANLLGLIVIDEMFDSNCCLDNPYYQATRLEMMSQLGVRPSTASLLPQPVPADAPLYTFGDLATYWNNNYPVEPSEWFSPIDPVALFIHFLVNEANVTDPASLLTDIIGGRFSTFPQWVDIVIEEEIQMDVASLERAWIAYQFSLTAVAQQDPPLPLPEQEVQLLCFDPVVGYKLFRYNAQTEALIFDGTLGEVQPKMMSLPNGDGVVVGMRTNNPTEARLFFWVNSRQTNLSWIRSQETPEALPLGFDPTETYLILGGEGVITGLMDYEACLNEGSCNFETMNGFPLWSPDQQQTLLAAFDFGNNLRNGIEYALVLGDSFGLEPENIADWQFWEGWSSFWISDIEIGFLAREEASLDESIMKVNVNSGESTSILSISEIEALLNNSITLDEARLNWVRSHPNKPDTLLMTVIVTADNQMPIFLIEYNLQQESGKILDIFNGQGLSNFEVEHFSPNGRFGALYSQDEANQNQLGIYDFEQDAMVHKIPNVYHEQMPLVWSDDSEWVLSAQGSALRITAVNHDYYQLLSFPEAQCEIGVWVNPQDDES